MSDFDPGEGWVQAAAESRGVEEGRDVLIRWQSGLPTYWVREEPVPPLPTEPYTVIRVTWKNGQSAVLILDTDGAWPAGLAESITGFKVLAKPIGGYEPGYVVIESKLREEVRRVTAKAVLERVRWSGSGSPWLNGVCDALAREFGVSDE